MTRSRVNLPRHQRGMSALAILTVLLIASFLLTCIFKVMPIYMDAWTVKSVIGDPAEAGEFDGKSVETIRKQIQGKFDMNRIETIAIKDVKFKNEKGKLIITANYEKRVPLIQNIDVVVHFDNFIYEVDGGYEDE